MSVRHSAISAVNDPAQSSFSSLEVFVAEVQLYLILGAKETPQDRNVSTRKCLINWF